MHRTSKHLVLSGLFSFGFLLADFEGFSTEVAAEEKNPNAATQAAKPWIFDQGLYTNSPASGQRVWQYKKDAPSYHDPTAIFDSSMVTYPFSPDPGYYQMFNYQNRMASEYRSEKGPAGTAPAAPASQDPNP